ncbi:RGP1 [Cordylochernes scorpioides]|uniref:RGP1 n=1 Tax=Cordylochernes scorpioides TaxID=51811 RepID=A0ABY6KS19_9ARAC|nr:RGP1 [Cordylochernes scorpioides]
MPVPSVPEDMPVSNIPEDMPVPTFPEDMPVSNVPEDMPVSTVPEDMPVPTVPEHMPVPTVPEHMPVPTVPEDMPVPTVPEDMSVSNVPEDMLVPTIPEDMPVPTVPEGVPYSVTLQSEEVVREEYLVQPQPSRGRVSYTKHHEVCLHLSHTNLVLPIPLVVTPSFSTNIRMGCRGAAFVDHGTMIQAHLKQRGIKRSPSRAVCPVSLRWKLHFEFVTSTSEALPAVPDAMEGGVWQGPSSLEVQTMVWDLPITIHPTHPLQVAQGLPAQPEATLTIW